jgi:hypothetical protein
MNSENLFSPLAIVTCTCRITDRGTNKNEFYEFKYAKIFTVKISVGGRNLIK